VAFVALDARQIAYVPVSELTSKQHGGLVTAVDFYIRKDEQPGRTYSSGKRRAWWGKFLDDYAKFPI
jgi:hypothetical protein